MEEYVKDAVDSSNDDEIIGLYDKELHLEKLKLSEIAEAKAEARIEGREEGIKEGREEGIRENSFEIAKKMLKEKIDIDLILRCTGLSKEDINKL